MYSSKHVLHNVTQNDTKKVLAFRELWLTIEKTQQIELQKLMCDLYLSQSNLNLFPKIGIVRNDFEGFGVHLKGKVELVPF